MLRRLIPGHRPRAQRRDVYLRDVAWHADGSFTITGQEPDRPSFSFLAPDQGAAICILELLRRGSFEWLREQGHLREFEMQADG